MNCPSCARPVAMAKETCIYCGATLSHGAQEEAALAAQRVLQSKSLTDLEAAATSPSRPEIQQRYIVIDTTAAPIEAVAAACSVNSWEARQWQAASGYRLVKVSTEPADGPTESRLRAHGLEVLVISGERVAQARAPLFVESIDASNTRVECSVRNDPGTPLFRTALREEDLALIISASIRRVKVKELGSLKRVPNTSLDDLLLVHLHVAGENRPWEIDTRRTAFEGAGLSSAHMQTLELVRRLCASAPHDESFRNVVPALGPGVDAAIELGGPARKSSAKAAKVVVLDNVPQFREYSAWRGSLALLQMIPRGTGTRAGR